MTPDQPRETEMMPMIAVPRVLIEEVIAALEGGRESQGLADQRHFLAGRLTTWADASSSLPPQEGETRAAVRYATSLIETHLSVAAPAHQDIMRRHIARLRDLEARHQEHLTHVGQFLSELYSIMVDPCAEGSQTVEETCAALRAAAIRDRDAIDQLHTLTRRQAEHASDLEAEHRRLADVHVCSGCGGPYRFDTSIPSVLWNRVIRAQQLPEYLCATCIIQHFVKAGVSFTAELFGDGFKGEQILVQVAGAESKTVTLLNDENNRLRTELRATEQRAQDAEARLATVKGVLDEHKETCRTLRAQLTTLQADLEARTRELVTG